MAEYRHSVLMNIDKCRGCTHCLKHCPTEAIRIRDGHAIIDPSRCIDCGECIRVCPYQAKKSVCDKLSDIPAGKWKIALPAPSLYGQFDNLDDIDYVLKGLLECGFDEVYEVARAAEIVSDYTRRYMKQKGVKHPVISSACPVVTRLISLRYPFLADKVLPIMPPIELAAIKAREQAKKTHPELKPEDICVVFISPCPAKVSYVKNKSADEKSAIDYVVSMSDIYFDLLGVMKKELSDVPESKTGMIGISWASAGGEATAIFNEKYLAADGIENITRVLEEIDNGTFPELEFIECNACPGGCVGGVMTVINPYIAKARLRSLRRYLPVSQNGAEGEGIPQDILEKNSLEYSPVVSFSNDRAESMRMMAQMEEFCKKLPGMDCGSCGAPTCRAFAADVIRGQAKPDECIVFMREKLRNIASPAKKESKQDDG